MTKHLQVLEEIRPNLIKTNRAVFITGSVARDEQSEHSDLDILLISKNKKSFREKHRHGITVELKKSTLRGFISKMNQDPMNIYQWLDAKAVYDPEDLLPKLKTHAQETFDNYAPISFPNKWLQSAKQKIESANATGNKESLGFHVSNNLWKVVEGFYLINATPLPPSSTAFKKIKTLKKLPQNFDVLWEQTLTGELDERAHTLIMFIEFIQTSYVI